jgi:hypothetical protein
VWRLVRHFGLPAGAEVDAGFLAQAPTGEACTATFDRLFHVPGRLEDLRSGA